MRAATFTTYINAKEDPGLEAAFARQARIATSSYATITRAAEQATRATAGLLGGRGTTGASQANTQINQRAAATNRVTTAAAAAERQTIKLATATRREATEANNAARANSALARSLTTTATALNVVQGPLGPLAGRLGATARAVTELTGARLGLAAFGASLFALGRVANNYANLEGRVRPFFETQKQVNAAMNDIIGIAQRSRAALEPVVDVYTRLTTVGQNIGLTRQGIGQITEIATKAAGIGGGSAQARDAALMQFGQALSGDFKAAGQEINSLKEQAPVLFQAILKGYKDVDGTVGVTLGRFKQMSEAGELSTAKVLDAVRRSASYIDQMAGRVPNTLSRAGTDFVNSITIMFGRFDQAVGFTSTLADGLSLIAANLRVITGLALGAGAAFAGMKLVGLASETAAALRATMVMSAAVKELGVRRQANAAASVAQHQREIAALNAEQREIQQNIALLERQRAVAARDVTRNAPDASAGFAGSSRRAASAAAEERRAVRALIQEKQRLGVITGALTAAQLRAQTSQARLEVATRNVTSRMGMFRSAIGSVVGFLGGPWAIAFAVATTAVYLLATAESAAEKATRSHEAAQRDFANIVDRATGKVYDQITALQKLDLARKQDTVSAGADQGAQTAKNDIVRTLAPLVAKNTISDIEKAYGIRGIRRGGPDPDVRTPEQRELTAALQAFNRLEKGSSPRLQALLADPRIRRGVPGLEGQLGKITGQFGAFDENRERLSQAVAGRRVVQGRARPGDLERAFGEPIRTTTGGSKPLTAAQLDANARAIAAQTDVERAKAELAQIKASGKQPGEDDAAYQNRLAAAYTNVKQAVEGEASARKAASAGKAGARRDAAEERREAAEREREARQAARDAAQGKRDDAQQSLEEMAPGISRQEYLDKRIEILQTYDDEMNAIEDGARASNTADRQRISDAREVAAARREITKSFEDQMAVSRLMLLGQTTEAEALRRTLELRERIGDAADNLQPVIEGQLRQEQMINDALASRERIVGLITGALDQARDTTEGFLTDLQTGGGFGDAFKTALKDFQTQFARINSRQLVEKLFAGSDAKLRAMLEGKSSVDTAIDQFGTSVDNLSTETSRGESAVSKFATAAEDAAARLDSIVAGGVSVTGAGADTSSIASAAAIAARSVGASLGFTAGSFAPSGANDNQDIVVEGQRVKKGMAPLVQATTPSARQVYNSIGTSLFGPIAKGLDSLVDKVTGARTSVSADGTKIGGSTFFNNMSKSFGTALQGAGQGAIASGFAKALGIKQSGTGAGIGGAIGALTGIPGGGFIGGLLGGTIGGLFQKPKYGSASVSLNQYGEAIGGNGAGNSSAARSAATGSAKSVADGINAIASQLGATISGLPGVTIGSFDGKARVALTNTSKSLNYNNFNQSNLKDFGKDGEAAAIEYAIRYSISNAVIDGISQASKNIIKSGQDLQQAINKALAIESIPKRLMQLTDPVRYAVSTLNDEFTKLISYLKEGGATAQQYADAQKLYDLERQNAIEAATKQAAEAIDQFLKDMVGSSASPLNKRTTYENAAKDLDEFKADIASGKMVDQNELLNAARNFQDASRTLNGSSSAFFDDFEMLRSLLAKARDNADITDVTTLPGSPFSSDSAVQAAIASLQASSTAATQTQTDALVAKLDQVVEAIDRGGVAGSGYYDDSSVGLLPGFRARNKVNGAY